jgi:hypothetical protein
MLLLADCCFFPRLEGNLELFKSSAGMFPPSSMLMYISCGIFFVESSPEGDSLGLIQKTGFP